MISLLIEGHSRIIEEQLMENASAINNTSNSNFPRQTQGKIIIKNDKKSKLCKVFDGKGLDLTCKDTDYIHVWTDGGGNCGPVSIGIVVVEKGIVTITHGEYLGDNSTNNVAELMAILRGLQLVRHRKKSVIIYSDSNYSLQSIAGGFNGVKNRELIERISAYIKNYPAEVILVKVKGHAKLQFNEMADSIASWFLQHVKEGKYLEKQSAKRKRKSE